MSTHSYRHCFYQCQMLRGDETGPKEHCQNLASATGYWQGQQLRVCEPHLKVIRIWKQQEADRDRQRTA